MKLPFHFDMETADPDDAMTLAILATHHLINLVSVSVHPGGPDQIGLVRQILKILDRPDVKIGAGKPKSIKDRVSLFHNSWIGKYDHDEADDTAANIMFETLSKHPGCTLVTGAALTNPHSLFKEKNLFFNRWFCQGGFAGDNIVPKEYRLPKFDGMITCPTYNLNGDPKAALELLSADITTYMVSKNVCHGAIFTKQDAQFLIPYRQTNKGIDLFLKAVDLKEKALHDTAAALLAIDASKAIWKTVIPYREKGQWGCREDNSNEGNKTNTAIHIPSLKDLWNIMISEN